MTAMRKKLYLGDALIVGLIFAVCALTAILPFLAGKTESFRIKVTVDGKTYGYFPLDTTLETPIGQTGVRLVIANGAAYISESDCPDKFCTHSGAIHVGDIGKSIVCLPNRVAITLDTETRQSINKTQSEVDAVAG